jgi:hypothetical protein
MTPRPGVSSRPAEQGVGRFRPAFQAAWNRFNSPVREDLTGPRAGCWGVRRLWKESRRCRRPLPPRRRLCAPLDRGRTARAGGGGGPQWRRLAARRIIGAHGRGGPLREAQPPPRRRRRRRARPGVAPVLRRSSIMRRRRRTTLLPRLPAADSTLLHPARPGSARPGLRSAPVMRSKLRPGRWRNGGSVERAALWRQAPPPLPGPMRAAPQHGGGSPTDRPAEARRALNRRRLAARSLRWRAQPWPGPGHQAGPLQDPAAPSGTGATECWPCTGRAGEGPL